jgi:hypothetical protein
MPTPLVRHFAGGEVTPELFGRFDLAKQQTGLALCQNFEILPHGIAESRAGFEFMRIENECELAEFSVSANENYPLSLCPGEICIIGAEKSGTFQWEPPSSPGAITIDGFVPEVGSSINVLTVDISGLSALNTGIFVRRGTDTGLSDIGQFGPPIDIGSVLYLENVDNDNPEFASIFEGKLVRISDIVVMDLGTGPENVYIITDLHGHGFDVSYLVTQDDAIVNFGSGQTETDCSVAIGPIINELTNRPFRIGSVIPAVLGGNAYTLLDALGNPFDTSGYTQAELDALAGTVTQDICIETGYTQSELSELVITQTEDVLTITHENHAPAELRRISPTEWEYSFIEFLPTIATPNAPTVSLNNPVGPVVTTFYKATAVAEETLEESLPSAFLQVNIGVTQAGGFVDIQMPNPAGAIRVNLYKLRNGLYMFAGQTVPGGIIRDDNIDPDPDKTAPFLVNPFVGDGNFPAVNGNFENRRVFAATRNRPQSYWMTASNSASNLSYSIPSQDDDAINGTLRSRRKARIRHVLPLGNLVFLTDGSEWKFSTVDNEPLTPSNAFPKQDSEEGCVTVRPIVSDNTAIFVPFSGTQIRRLEYKWQKNALTVEDITVLAPHLFKGRTIVSLAYQRAPYRAIWAVRDDGVLLCATYHPEHDVLAWHRHVTDGEFESVTCVKEGREYALYAVIRRDINGTSVRYLERKRSRFFESLEDSFCVDSGKTYDGPATTEIYGASHLIGEEVAILADGQVHPSRVVDEEGHFTLDFEASVVHFGLPYRCRLQTIPPALEGVEGFGQHYEKNVDKVHVRLHETVIVKAGPNFDTMREIAERDGEDWDEPAQPKSKIVEIPVDPEWNVAGQVCVEQDLPLPATVLGLVIEMASEGTK